MATAAAMDAVTQAFQATTGTMGIWGVEQHLIWALVVGFIVAFVLSFAVGANDVANSFGTAVGAKVLTLKQACLLATVFETAGAVLMGAKVGQTIRKGIIDPQVYNDTSIVGNGTEPIMNYGTGTEVLLLGQLSAMFGSTVWQLIATLFKLPVSGTHSIVGGVIGFSLVARGFQGLNFKKLLLIVLSWFVSPVLSGIMAVILFIFIKKVILEKEHPLRNGLVCLPVFYGLTMAINILSIFISGAPLIGLEIKGDHKEILIFGLTAGVFILTFLIVSCLVVPYIKKRALKAMGVSDVETPTKEVTYSPTDDTTTSQDSVNSDSSITFKKGYRSANDSGYQTPCCDKTQVAQPPPMSVSNVIEKMTEMKETHLDASIISETEPLTPGSDKELILAGVDIGLKGESEKCEEKAVLQEEEKRDDDEDEDPLEVAQIFSSLQVLTACFASFAHGANDVSNAIGPLIALWLIFFTGEVSNDEAARYPWYLLVYGASGICLGLWVLGRRVIETIGSKLTTLTPSRGFCIELMTAVTVLLASNVGIPVSTTHCKVGAVVSIGLQKSRKAVDWSLVKNIGLAWFVTLPVSGLISALAMYLLMFTVGL